MFNILALYGKKKSNWISGCQGYVYIMLSGMTAKNIIIKSRKIAQ